jgi:rRNA maturation endonuclease Nob1
MNGQEYRAAILATGLSITDYAKHIGLTRQGFSSRFKLAKVTNEMVLAVERVAEQKEEQDCKRCGGYGTYHDAFLGADYPCEMCGGCGYVIEGGQSK